LHLTQTRSNNMKRLTRLEFALDTLLFSLITACTTSHSSVPNVPATRSQRDTAPSESENKGWVPQLKSGRSQYLIHDSSTVSISNDTTAPAVLIESATLYSISIADTDTVLIVTAHIDSQYINSSHSIKTKQDSTLRPDIHIAISRQGKLLSKQPVISSVDCSATNTPTPSRIDELLIPLPRQISKIGDKWTDTLSSTTCRGHTLLTHVTIREHELLDLSSSCQQHEAVKVRQTISETVSGSSAGHNHLGTNGSGTATSVLCLERSTGMLLESKKQSRLDLTVTTIRGVFPFTQNTSTSIERREY
jgi:hypothetical protein